MYYLITYTLSALPHGGTGTCVFRGEKPDPFRFADIITAAHPGKNYGIVTMTSCMEVDKKTVNRFAKTEAHKMQGTFFAIAGIYDTATGEKENIEKDWSKAR